MHIADPRDRSLALAKRALKLEDIKDLKEGKWPVKGWAYLSYEPIIGGAEFETVLRSPDFWKG